MTDVFISYARADKERVAPLARALEERGWSVWWDRDITPGRTFDEEIEEALDASKVIVAVWTQAGVASRWVRTEAAEGLNRSSFVPVLLEDVRIPLAFRRVQAADLTNWEPGTATPGFELLVAAIERLLQAAPPGGPAEPKDAVSAAVAIAETRMAESDWDGVVAVLAPLTDQVEDFAQRRPRAAELLETAMHQQAVMERYEEAEVDYADGRWQQAIDKLEHILGMEPESKHAESLLLKAKRHLDREREERFARAFSRGKEALDRRDFIVAVARLEQLLHDAPDYPDAQAALEQAQAGAAAEERYRRARTSLEEQNWNEVLSLTAEIARDVPGFGDPERLAERAQAGLARESADRAAAQFARGLGLLDSREYEAAEAALEQVVARWPDREDARDALDRARAGVSSAAAYHRALELFGEGRRDEAVAAVDTIVRANPDFGDPEGLISQVEEQHPATVAPADDGDARVQPQARPETVPDIVASHEEPATAPSPGLTVRDQGWWRQTRRMLPTWTLGATLLTAAYLTWLDLPGRGINATSLQISWLFTAEPCCPDIEGVVVTLAFPLVALALVIGITATATNGKRLLARRIAAGALLAIAALHLASSNRTFETMEVALTAVGFLLMSAAAVVALLRDPLLSEHRSLDDRPLPSGPPSKMAVATSGLAMLLLIGGLLAPWHPEPVNGFGVNGLAFIGLGMPDVDPTSPYAPPLGISVGIVALLAVVAAGFAGWRRRTRSMSTLRTLGLALGWVIAGYGFAVSGHVETEYYYGTEYFRALVDATGAGFWISLLGAVSLALLVALDRRWRDRKQTADVAASTLD